VITDARALPGAQVSPPVRAGLIGAYVAVPVHLHGGVLYGTLCAFDTAAMPDLDTQAPAVLRLLAVEIAGLLDLQRAEQARRHRLLSDLDALARTHQPRIALQPVVDLATGAVLGYEALSRFDDGRAPDVWFAEAAAAGAGVRLELAAFDNALALALPPGTQLCVNLSSEVIVSGPLQRRLAALAERVPDRLACLVVELTEHEAVSDYDAVEVALRPWRAGGLRLSIDDTGAGHSSLTHVLRLQPDVVKLDRLLITELDHDPVRRSLVKALTAFCGEVGIDLIAEGVENAAELACLTELGVPFAQGYHLGRPALAVPREELQGAGARSGA
jgi:EAL domain-containing protein (putative c-di-GMP-specific phosphodiesterase class I)